MKKLLCGITAVIMTCAMASCSDSEENQQSQAGNQLVSGADKNVNLSQDDMPYGATICELSSANDEHITIMTDFDKRYFADADDNPNYDEVYKIYDYIIAIDTNDHDLLKSITYPGFYEHFCEENDLTFDEYIDSVSAQLHDDIGEDSAISFIDISNCTYDGENVEAFYSLRDEILSEIGAGEVTSRKTVEIGGYTTFNNSTGSYLLTEHSQTIVICVYEIDGQTYIL